MLDRFLATFRKTVTVSVHPGTFTFQCEANIQSFAPALHVAPDGRILGIAPVDEDGQAPRGSTTLPVYRSGGAAGGAASPRVDEDALGALCRWGLQAVLGRGIGIRPHAVVHGVHHLRSLGGRDAAAALSRALQRAGAARVSFVE